MTRVSQNMTTESSPVRGNHVHIPFKFENRFSLTDAFKMAGGLSGDPEVKLGVLLQAGLYLGRVTPKCNTRPPPPTIPPN